ncbi:aldehyde dehydrogenase family protein [Planctomicrobium piriforme]|uniref:Aldehyde dehydrogenase (NAD+) n=1 Tax=Planctomicrobium piriforme TaxID=1576369 RepID=A0A1I3BCX8_9PLAN|nr:aldehyde dehydrogenase family protein [Planctomicrobium piriforme]SFH59799.1 aldehyde dehydrogenase (NAD+) [Planctomicrobium piriforme]
MSTAVAPKKKIHARPEVRRTQLLIDGEWKNSVSGETFPTYHPATEEKIADVAKANAQDVDLAVKAARKAFETGPWPKMDARDRGRLLNKLADLIEANLDELAALETLDNGKPINDARNADIPLVIDVLRYYAGWADKLCGQTLPVRGNYFSYTRKEPVGVVGQIIPWNFPALMVSWKWAPALAAGCTIVMKPAEQTPLSCLRMAELAMEAGFPKGVINVITGFGDAGAAIVKHPDVDKIAFTGSTETGQIIMREASHSLKRITFELGGKSPNIIFADADIEAAIHGAEFGLFFNQGQCCCAGSRLFVEKSIHKDFVKEVVSRAKQRKTGNPFDSETTHGPQIDNEQFKKIMDYIDQGKKAGADCVIGGKRHGDKGFFIEPTVFDNVTDEMAIATDEIFGPVLSVLPFDSVEEAIQRGNKTNYGLAAAVWTKDISKAHRVAAALRAGTVWVNCYDVFDAAAPFGGFKQSGIGRELGEAALASYTELKTVTVSLS